MERGTSEDSGDGRAYSFTKAEGTKGRLGVSQVTEGPPGSQGVFPGRWGSCETTEHGTGKLKLLLYYWMTL